MTSATSRNSAPKRIRVEGSQQTYFIQVDNGDGDIHLNLPPPSDDTFVPGIVAHILARYPKTVLAIVCAAAVIVLGLIILKIII